MEPFRVDAVTSEPCEYTSQMNDTHYCTSLKKKVLLWLKHEASCKLVLMDEEMDEL
jgi:hypothetical protein